MAISDDEGVIGNHRHPIIISSYEFLIFFRKMAVVTERLAMHDVMKRDYHDNDELKQRRASIDFNGLDDDLDDGIILYLKMLQLEEGYIDRFNETKNCREKKREMIRAWNNAMHALYRKLMIEHGVD